MIRYPWLWGLYLLLLFLLMAGVIPLSETSTGKMVTTIDHPIGGTVILFLIIFPAWCYFNYRPHP
jgi:fumarate reductase subunit D